MASDECAGRSSALFVYFCRPMGHRSARLIRTA